jgi:hypothetical protein
METVRFLKSCLDIIGFPFSLAILCFEKKRKIKEPGILVQLPYILVGNFFWWIKFEIICK